MNYNKERIIVRKIREAEQLLQQIKGNTGRGREGQGSSANADMNTDLLI